MHWMRTRKRKRSMSISPYERKCPEDLGPPSVTATSICGSRKPATLSYWQIATLLGLTCDCGRNTVDTIQTVAVIVKNIFVSSMMTEATEPGGYFYWLEFKSLSVIVYMICDLQCLPGEIVFSKSNTPVSQSQWTSSQRHGIRETRFNDSSNPVTGHGVRRNSDLVHHLAFRVRDLSQSDK